MKRMLKVLTIYCLFWLQGCGSGSVVETETPVSSTSTTTPAPSQSATYTPTAIGPVAVGTLLDRSLSLQIVYTGGPTIFTLRAGPDNNIYIADYKADTIYRLLEDGTVEKYLSFPGTRIDFFDFAPDGTLWLSLGGVNLEGGLYHYRWGSLQLIAKGVNLLYDFDSAGNLYAVGPLSSNVQRITPDGKVETIASGDVLIRSAPAIGPDDRIYITTLKGELLRAETDGSFKLIATGFGPEDTPAFTSDGKLYVLGWFTGLRKVDAATGQVEQVEWFSRYWSIGGLLAFDGRGFGYAYHPLLPLFRFDLEAETLDVVYHPHQNSIAMAVDPLTETPYIAYGNRLPGGETVLFRVGSGGGLEKYGSVPYGIERFLTFAPDGTGYLSVGDRDNGNMIYTFKPQGGSLEEFVEIQAQSMAVDPRTGDLWVPAGDHLVGYNADLEQSTIPLSFEGVNFDSIAFGPDGTLFSNIWFFQGVNLPFINRLYRYENGDWTLLKEVNPKDPTYSGGIMTTCPDGHVYIIPGWEDAQPSSGVSKGGLVRLENDNTFTLIGYDLGDFDQLAMSCTPSGTLYFTNVHGIYSISNLGAAP